MPGVPGRSWRLTWTLSWTASRPPACSRRLPSTWQPVRRAGRSSRELRSLFASERQGRFEQPPTPGEFDFGYLQIGPFFGERSNLTVRPDEPARPPKPWRLDTLGRLVIQFSADLLRSLAAPDFAASYLKGDVPASLNYALTGQLDDLNVRINVEPSRRDPQQTSVEVEVDIPSRGGWPNLAGNTVLCARCRAVAGGARNRCLW